MYTHIDAVTCNYPPPHDPVAVINGAQDSHPLMKGKHITYTCPPGFVLTGPNASVCTGNGEWEPDPGQVDCLGDCAQSQWCSMRIHLFLVYPSLS